MVSEPIVVLFKAKGCKYCDVLMSYWDKVVLAIKQVYPKMRFTVLTVNSMSDFDPNTIPNGMRMYRRWFPMTLLVPGHIWDRAMADVGPSSTVEIVDGVQVFNGEIVGKTVNQNIRYDARNQSGYASWIQEALRKPEFIRAQNSPGPVIPNHYADIMEPVETPKIVKHEANSCGLNLVSRYHRPSRRI